MERKSNEQFMKELDASEHRYETLICSRNISGDEWEIIETDSKNGRRVTYVNSKTREIEYGYFD